MLWHVRVNHAPYAKPASRYRDTLLGREGEKLRRRIGRCREHLSVFVAERDVPPTNNVSERALRPSVVFRKVTNEFRAEWGAETYAAFRSVVSTAKANGETVLAAVQDALRRQIACAPG